MFRATGSEPSNNPNTATLSFPALRSLRSRGILSHQPGSAWNSMSRLFRQTETYKHKPWLRVQKTREQIFDQTDVGDGGIHQLPKVSQQTWEALSFLQHFSNVRAARAKVENSIPNLRRKVFILPRTKSKRPKSVVCQKNGYHDIWDENLGVMWGDVERMTIRCHLASAKDLT